MCHNPRIVSLQTALALTWSPIGNGHLGVVPPLKSQRSVIKCTEPINTTAKAARMKIWRERLKPLDASVHLNISADEHLPAGAENPWTTWKALNRLRTQVGRSRVNLLSGNIQMT